MKRKPPPLIAPIAFLENRWLTHGLFWAIVLSLLLGGGYGQSSVSPFFKMTLIEFSGYFVFSYIVLLILVPYFLYSSRFTGFIILSVLLNVVFAYVMYKTNTMALKDIPGIEELNIFTTLPVFVLFFFMVTAIKLGKDLLIVQHENEITQRQKLQQELSFLRGQLSPHFLLNTMNNLYGLSVIKSDKLPNLMLRLSDLLRYTIYDTKTDRVPLKNEVKYLMDYIELQKIRLSSKVRLMVDFPTEMPEKWTIVPLLLVVFVENAFKHSQTSANERAPFIHFDIAVTEGYLHFIAENSFEEQAKTPDDFTIEKEGGLGLQTTLRRIELIYGKTALPKITTNDGCHRVELKLKLTDGKD